MSPTATPTRAPTLPPTPSTASTTTTTSSTTPNSVVDCDVDGATRRRSGRTCSYFADTSPFCSYAPISRRRSWGGEAADTCQNSCAASLGCRERPTPSPTVSTSNCVDGSLPSNWSCRGGPCACEALRSLCASSGRWYSETLKKTCAKTCGQCGSVLLEVAAHSGSKIDLNEEDIPVIINAPFE